MSSLGCALVTLPLVVFDARALSLEVHTPEVASGVVRAALDDLTGLWMAEPHRRAAGEQSRR